MHGHAEHDPADYVPKELFEEWARRDPIELFERRLLDAGILDGTEVERVKGAVLERVRHDVARARQDPMPDPSTVEDGVYAD
jgi:pyruvate dehydrogenase E1 component alpha subunit